MGQATIAVYRMNPDEDQILFGDQITDGMWVLNENARYRTPMGETEDEQIRAQRFRRVTRLRTTTTHAFGAETVFVGEWVDGYQKVHGTSSNVAWLVKKPREEG